MRQVEAAKPGVFDGLLQLLVLKLRHLATLGTDLVVMRISIVAFFILGGGTKLVLDDQPCIDQQNDGIVKGSPADTEILMICHERVERIDIEMAIDRIDRVEYGIAFGGLAMPVHIEILREYLLDCIFHILTFHNPV